MYIGSDFCLLQFATVVQASSEGLTRHPNLYDQLVDIKPIYS
jgi:hypothetical protein